MGRLPDITKELITNASRERIVALIHDPRDVASCVPGLQSFSILNEMDSLWEIKIHLPMVTRTVKFKAHIETVSAGGLTVSLEGVNEQVSGKMSAALDDVDGGTRITLSMALNAKGIMSVYTNRLISQSLPGLIDGFTKNVEEKLLNSVGG